MDKKNSFLGAMIKDACILFAITLIAGVLLGFVNDITKDIIAQRKADAKTAANQAVSPGAASFETIEEALTFEGTISTSEGAEVTYAGGVMTFASGDTCEIEEVLSALNESGEQVGYVVTVTSNNGYGGDIQMSVGIDMEGTVTGVEMLTINESAGLGANASKAEFRDQYKDKTVDQFTVTKTGKQNDNEIDALSGATITSKAVTNGVNAALLITRAISPNQ